MDASLLTTASFWNDSRPFAAGEVPDIPELAGHVLFETSGSSGNPKWVALSRDALLASAAAVNSHLRVTSESCWGLALPLNHVGGFGVAARSYQASCRLESLARRWDAESFHQWLATTGVTHTSLVPTQVHDLVKLKLTAPSSLAAIVVGGGHLDPVTGQAARDLGWPVLASYGMSEAASQIGTQGLDLLDKPYQAAPIPLLPIWQAEINADGLLSIAGPALFSGYVSDGKFTRRLSEWHITSDRAMIGNGCLTPLGRADTLVKILGELVDPELIERELASLSAGRLALGTFAIIATPDDRAGNALTPVFESSADVGMVGSVLTLYHARAPGFRRLNPARMVEELPRSGLGKIKRAELASMIDDLSDG